MTVTNTRAAEEAHILSTAELRPVSFGLHLRRCRLAAGLTQEELAERADMSVRGISDLERGVNRTPYRTTVGRLADALALDRDARALFEDMARQRPPRAERPAIPRRSGAGLPLVGREQERESLHRYLEGDGPVVLFLSGEPGIGKTRLLSEAAEAARSRGMTVLSGGCQRSQGQEPYAPVAATLGDAIAGMPVKQLRAAVRGCAWLVRLLPELAEVVSTPLPSGADPSPQERRLLFAAVARFIGNLGGAAGVLLVLDDLQWAAADGLALLRYLPASAGGIALRVIGAFRDTEVQPGEPLAILLADLADAGEAALLPLLPLGDEAAADLLRAAAGDTGPPADGGRIVERAGGIPFFLLSSIQAGTAGEMPWTMAQSVHRRVAALPPKTQELLHTAAAAGRTVARSILLEVDAGDEAEVRAALDAACRARLLTTCADGGYSFTHDVIREVIEEGLGPAQRAFLHRRLGDALERAHARDRWSRGASELAWHFALGEAPHRAIPYALAAGGQARDAFAHAEAERHYRHAIELARDAGNTAGEAEARRCLGAVLISGTRLEESIAESEEAAALYRGLGDRDGEAHALAQVGWSLCLRGAWSDALMRLEPVAGEMEQHPPSRGLAEIYIVLTFPLYSSRNEDGLAAAERAAAIAADLGDLPLLSRAEVRRGLALRSLDRLEESCAVLEGAVCIGEDAGNLEGVVHGLAFLAHSYALLGDMVASMEATRRAVAAAERRGEVWELGYGLRDLGDACLAVGDWPQARLHLERCVDLDRTVPPHQFSAGFRLTLARLDLLEGRENEALALAEEADDIDAALGMSEKGTHGHWVRACLALRRGDTRAAVAELDAISLSPETAHLLFERERVEAYLGRSAPGDLERAAEIIARHEPPSPHRAVSKQATLWLWLRAALLRRQGSLGEAEDTCRQALAAARALPYPEIEALTLDELAEVHRQSGNGSEADAAAQESQAIFRRLGATGHLHANTAPAR